jgi:hypothetical protein
VRGITVQARRAKMAAPMAPTTAEFSITLLADAVLGLGPTPVEVPVFVEVPVILEEEAGGLVVVGRVDDPGVVTGGREVVLVTLLILTPPPEVLPRQLVSVEGPTSKFAVTEVIPVESRNNSERVVPEGYLHSHVTDVAVEFSTRVSIKVPPDPPRCSVTV